MQGKGYTHWHSIRATIEQLGQAGFKPQRSIVLAFGIDEEHGGIIVRTRTQFNLHVSADRTIRAAPTSGITSSPHTERTVSRSSLTKEVGPHAIGICTPQHLTSYELHQDSWKDAMMVSSLLPPLQRRAISISGWSFLLREDILVSRLNTL